VGRSAGTIVARAATGKARGWTTAGIGYRAAQPIGYSWATVNFLRPTSADCAAPDGVEPLTQ
jgi:hypothetical protein